MKPAVDVKKLYATAFDSLDSFGRVLDELAQRRVSRASGNGSKGNGSACAEPEADACAEADAEPEKPSESSGSSEPPEPLEIDDGEDIEDTRRLGTPDGEEK